MSPLPWALLLACLWTFAGLTTAPVFAAETRGGVTSYTNEDLKAAEPQFKVVGQSQDLASVLVAPGASEADIRKLLYLFKSALEDDLLTTWFTPSTPGDRRGDFSRFRVFIFSDPAAASIDEVVRFADKKPEEGTEAQWFWGKVRGRYVQSFETGESGEIFVGRNRVKKIFGSGPDAG